MNMDTETINNHLKKLEELVIDEDKIVTVPSLCTTFNVTAKESKLLLDQFIETNRKAHPRSLALTYILSGLREHKTPTVSIVKEDKLDEKKALYTGEPLCTIYSVQKCKEIDFNSVTLIDCFDVSKSRESPIKGSIVSSNCIKRQLKTKPVVTSIVKPTPPTKVPPKIPVVENGIKHSPKSASVKPGSSRKGSSVAELFKNVEPKSKSTTEATDSIKTETRNSEITSSIQHLVDSDDDSDVVKPTPEPTSSKKRKSTKKSTNSKQRKRIVVQEESDEDMFASDDEEKEELSRKRKNVIEDSEEDEPVAKPEPAPKNKKRKLVDKTFEDEEGYVITRKEWVEVSGSEDEEKAEVVSEKGDVAKVEVKKVEEKKGDKSEVNKNEKAVNGKAQKGKKAVPTNQPTLMNFFKKK
ncbi:hypothetical protein PPYR_10168 [Photinus pyralis]|uniref:DNA polymerase delta subunit 3 n=1 Tax=Photinus pyralis TaxID=7054 RepID=A0A5N4AFK9_PHOPY|nr:DNA polymerase delta subunit 3-like [Photinus pyralis]KAB0796107.1 hypothetical protein PPYR_10168 [Photinus pyralis]